MLETLADHDDALMEQLLEDIQPPRDTVFADLAAEMRAGQILPVFIGSAAERQRHPPASEGASPRGAGHRGYAAAAGRRGASDAIAQVLKTIHTSHAGKLSVVRVLSGKIDDPMELAGAQGEAGKVSGIYKHARAEGRQARRRFGRRDRRARQARACAHRRYAGREGLRSRADRRSPRRRSRCCGRRPADRAEGRGEALVRAHPDDGGGSVAQRRRTARIPAETVLGGQGEMHLRVAVERLTGRYGLTLETRRALVPYRETIRASVVEARAAQEAERRARPVRRRRSGGASAAARRGHRLHRHDHRRRRAEATISRRWRRACARRCRTARSAAFPLVDVGVTLTDGSYHTVDSSEQAFRMAGILAMREALPECRPVLLEPILKVRIAVPSDATAGSTPSSPAAAAS